jgi:osmotically-inducible protein OsmY
MTHPTTRLLRILALATLTGATLLSGCAVMRGQETAGAYVDDAAITTAIKAKFVEDKIVSAGSISVETLNGTVQLSGFANSAEEKSKAEQIARNSRNVRAVRNDIIVRP